MTLQALSGVFALRLVSREGSPSLLEVRHTHTHTDNYINLQLDDNIDDIICHKKDPTQPNWKIALPKSMVVDTVKWFYQVMGHPGEKRL